MNSRALKAVVTASVYLLASVTIVGAQAPRRVTNLPRLQQLATDMSTRFQVERAAAVRWAREQNIPLRIEQSDGSVTELMYIRDGSPVYYTTNSANAADTVSTDELWPGGSSLLDLDGTGVLLHIWDAGAVRDTHQELAGRVTKQDDATTANHSTHVGGIMIATGVEPAARGMANMADLDSYDWTNDQAEMAAAAAAGAVVSNHSYATAAGWYQDSDSGDWYWFGDIAISTTEDYMFGFYDSGTRDWDEIAFNAPFYLIVKGTANDRDDAHSGAHFHRSGEGPWVSSTDTHPADGPYDSIPPTGTAKNILTVGAVNDIIGGYVDPEGVLVTSFSGWGPTDDGRIKPDIMANGTSVYSCSHWSDTSYYNSTGTSMSTPNVSGSIGLLVEHYRATHAAADMRSATVKALVVHSADEAGAADGPDYSAGWGLFNAQSAAELISADQISPSIIQELSISQGGVIERDYPSFGSGPLKVTIAWTDPPGTPPPAALDPTTPTLVNDLDLRVIGPQGATTYEPWILDPANPADAATTGDNTGDNVEVIAVDTPAPGVYTIQVSHKGTLQGGSQDFSLVTNDHGGVYPPQGDDLTASLGVFRLWIVPNLRPLFAGYPGYDGGFLASPTLCDTATVVGRSDPFAHGDAEDAAGVPVGTADTMIGDDDFALSPAGFQGPVGRQEIHTEVRSLELTLDGVGTLPALRAGVAAQLGALPISPGEVEATAGFEWPAESFSDLFFEIEIPDSGLAWGGANMAVYNASPLLIQSTGLLELPPRAVYVHGNSTAVPVGFRNSNPPYWHENQLLGFLVLFGHGLGYDCNAGATDVEEFETIMETVSGMPLLRTPSTTPYGATVLVLLIGAVAACSLRPRKKARAQRRGAAAVAPW
jgi:hypothetical protein